MIYSALEKKKRTDFNVTENNPEITKHNETDTANGNHKRSLTYAADAAWPLNGSYLPTPNFEKWTRLTYKSTRTAWPVTQWTEIPPTSGAHLSVRSGSI
jgi:hypothetical protein